MLGTVKAVGPWDQERQWPTEEQRSACAKGAGFREAGDMLYWGIEFNGVESMGLGALSGGMEDR